MARRDLGACRRRARSGRAAPCQRGLHGPAELLRGEGSRVLVVPDERRTVMASGPTVTDSRGDPGPGGVVGGARGRAPIASRSAASALPSAGRRCRDAGGDELAEEAQLVAPGHDRAEVVDGHARGRRGRGRRRERRSVAGVVGRCGGLRRDARRCAGRGRGRRAGRSSVATAVGVAGDRWRLARTAGSPPTRCRRRGRRRRPRPQARASGGCRDPERAGAAPELVPAWRLGEDRAEPVGGGDRRAPRHRGRGAAGPRRGAGRRR